MRRLCRPAGSSWRGPWRRFGLDLRRGSDLRRYLAGNIPECGIGSRRLDRRRIGNRNISNRRPGGRRRNWCFLTQQPRGRSIQDTGLTQPFGRAFDEVRGFIRHTYTSAALRNARAINPA